MTALASFREIVEADLRRAQRLVVKVQDEIDWQWRLATPDGDVALATTMPEDAVVRAAMLARLADLFAVKQVAAFTLAVELREPDAVCCFGVAYRKFHACLSPIERRPRPWTPQNFGAIAWLPDTIIDPAIIELLPRGNRTITAARLAELDTWFGDGGRFPAVTIAKGAQPISV